MSQTLSFAFEFLWHIISALEQMSKSAYLSFAITLTVAKIDKIKA